MREDHRRAATCAAGRHGTRSRTGSGRSRRRSSGDLPARHRAAERLPLGGRPRPTPSRADIDRALYDERSVVKQLAMRRTLFAFPRDLLPAVWGSASDRVARQLRTRLAKEVEANGIAKRRRGLAQPDVRRRCSAALAEDGPATTAELRERIPALARRLELAPGKAYGGSFPIAPRVLGTLAASGAILRGGNDGDWRVSRPRWTLTEDWLGGARATKPSPKPATASWSSAGCARFGPGTEADLVWWLGRDQGRRTPGAGRARRGGGRPRRRGRATCCPTTSTTCPSRSRGRRCCRCSTRPRWAGSSATSTSTRRTVPHLFDTNGNAGTTAWWCGRVVGCWVQDHDGVVLGRSSARDIGAEAMRALDAEAERLTHVARRATGRHRLRLAADEVGALP